jgi:hypothetical protein
VAQESEIETPTAEELARFDRKRKGGTQSHAEWKSPTDPDARYAEMMGGTKQLTYKLEHAVSSVKASSMPSVDRPRAKLERQTLGSWVDTESAALRHEPLGARPFARAPGREYSLSGCSNRTSVWASAHLLSAVTTAATRAVRPT